MIKNQPAYYHQARVEVGVLQYLNTRADAGDKHHIVRMKVRWAKIEWAGRRSGGVTGATLGGGVVPIVRMRAVRCAGPAAGATLAVKCFRGRPPEATLSSAALALPAVPGPSPLLPRSTRPTSSTPILQDFFLFRNHLCLTFELLNLNLYELIRHNKFRGLSLPLVRVFTTQVRGWCNGLGWGWGCRRLEVGAFRVALWMKRKRLQLWLAIWRPQGWGCLPHHSGGYLRPNLAHPTLLQILDALVVLRDSRIVHCDLKPENVLLKTIETGGCRGNVCVGAGVRDTGARSRAATLPSPPNCRCVLAGHAWCVGGGGWVVG